MRVLLVALSAVVACVAAYGALYTPPEERPKRGASSEKVPLSTPSKKVTDCVGRVQEETKRMSWKCIMASLFDMFTGRYLYNVYKQGSAREAAMHVNPS